MAYISIMSKWSSRLDWNDLAGFICGRLARVNFLLRRLRKWVTDQYLVMVYHAMFDAHIAYRLHLGGTKRMWQSCSRYRKLLFVLSPEADTWSTLQACLPKTGYTDSRYPLHSVGTHVDEKQCSPVKYQRPETPETGYNWTYQKRD